MHDTSAPNRASDWLENRRPSPRRRWRAFYRFYRILFRHPESAWPQFWIENQSTIDDLFGPHSAEAVWCTEIELGGADRLRVPLKVRLAYYSATGRAMRILPLRLRLPGSG